MSELVAVLLDFLGTMIRWERSFWKEDDEENGLD